MIKHFSANAPIRRKFDMLILLRALLAAVPLAVTLSGVGGLLAIELAEGVALLVLVGVMVTAKRLICDPYVSTVVRMEELASGDLASPIPYVHYEDRVGRMSRAMLIFRDNAKGRQQANAALQDVIGEATSALGHLRDGDLGYKIRINAALGERANAISHAFNYATAALSVILSKVAEAASNVLNGATEIRSASDDLATRTEQQAANAAGQNQKRTPTTKLVTLGSSPAALAKSALRPVFQTCSTPI